MTLRFKTITAFIFSLLGIIYLSSIANAQVPGFKVPCDREKDPEFHSLRPYQASPCGDSPKSYFCNNDYVIEESVSVPFDEGSCTKSGNQYICPCTNSRECDISKTYLVNGVSANFPILGNTEEVNNSQGTGTMDDATKMNEYLSWYLNGTVYRAEDKPLEDKDAKSNDKIINFSGPINKLLPESLLEAQRIESINQALTTTTYTDDSQPSGTTTQVTEPENHNQIVVCAEETILWNWGKTVPHECYASKGGDEYRLKDWDGDLSDFNKLVNRLGGDAWNKRTPPLPWETDQNGNPMFTDNNAYIKAYNEWRGEACINIPVVDKMLCFDNPFVANKWASLFPYIPLANTVDKNAKHYVGGVSIRSDGQTDARLESYNILHEPVLFYPHTKETFTLTNILKGTFKPKEEEGGLGSSTPTDITTKDFEQNGCTIADVRSNEGDELFPSSKDGRDNDLEVKVHIVITQVACPAGPIDKWLEDCAGYSNGDPGYPKKCGKEPDCDGTIYVGIRTSPKIPYLEKITKETVTGPNSIFRRIFPKTGENSPISCIADIPGTTKIEYQPGDNTDLVRIENPAGSEDPANATLFFPGLGTIYEYMLKGIQTALRPKGYGDPLTNGTLCNNLACGELPKFNNKNQGTCGLGNVSSRVGNIPQNLKDIISEAAFTYKVPPNLILGVMYGEGAFNPGRYSWTDDNVANWATCENLPNCSGPETSVVPFISAYWDKIAQRIGPDLKKLDPNRTTVNPCNLLDAVFALASDLHNNAGGGSIAGNKCFDITMTSTNPTSCTWEDGEYESAIKMWENGNNPECFTRTTGCMLGDSVPACGYDPNSDTQCETVGNHSSDPSVASHNACVWDVAHGN